MTPQGTDAAWAMARNAAPYLYGPEAEALIEALNCGYYGHNEITARFEDEVAAFLGVPDAVAVASGTAALHLALIAAGIGAGDEVVVPSMTFCATVQAIRACGAYPRFAEVDQETLCVTAETLREAITPSTRAVVPVLYGGRPIDISSILNAPAGRRITVVQDAAHAFGSRTHTGMVGADLRVVTCFSFGPIKNLTCGQGGMVIPRTPEQARTIRTARMLGVAETAAERSAATSYEVNGMGLRYQMPSLNAAVGRVQLAHFSQAQDMRRGLWRAYAAAVGSLDGVDLVDVDPERAVPSLCAVRVQARDAVFAFLRRRGVGAGVHYPPNHLQPAFAAWRRPLPVTEKLGRQILTLPFHQHLSEDSVRLIGRLLEEAVNARRAR